MRLLAINIMLSLSCMAWADALEFDEPLTVSSAAAGVFHHLEASGRRSMVVANGTVVIVWEDNSSGTPQIYLAHKKHDATTFSQPMQVSQQGPAYEPVIATLGESYVVGWEANDQLWLRQVSPTSQGAITALSKLPARQLTLVTTPGGDVMAAWSEQHLGQYHIVSGLVSASNKQLVIKPHGFVDTSSDKKEQLYPALAVTTTGSVVAWEDRRQGATRIFTAFAPINKPFVSYQRLNDFVQTQNLRYGRGTGAMRVVLDSDRSSQVTATWMDKRDFGGGYDVYAAYSTDGGRSFGENEIVQDALGENTPQWHGTVAMSQGADVIAAWDDTRDGSADIWYSMRKKAQWSNDEVWPGGSGDGAQTLPVLVCDQHYVHVAWLDRRDKVSAIRYSRALLRGQNVKSRE